jgi:hypothetical protein
MLGYFFSLLLAVPSSAAAPAPPSWEKVFEGTTSDRFVTALHATGRDDWFMGGGWGVARVSKSLVVRENTRGRAVLGLFYDGPNSVFALGTDELVLHYDGKSWTQEHLGPAPKRPGRGADLLHSAFYVDASSDAPLAAFGPWLVLVRQTNGAWTLPPEPERERLSNRGELGPEIKRPPKCDAAGWDWIGKDNGVFFCHDRRAFLFEAGTITPKGTIPRQCYRSFDSLTYANGDIYASCSEGTLWKTEGQLWRSIAPPKRLKEIPAVSVADGCVFVASGRSVWRSCDH